MSGKKCKQTNLPRNMWTWNLIWKTTKIGTLHMVLFRCFFFLQIFNLCTDCAAIFGGKILVKQCCALAVSGHQCKRSSAQHTEKKRRQKKNVFTMKMESWSKLVVNLNAKHKTLFKLRQAFDKRESERVSEIERERANTVHINVIFVCHRHGVKVFHRKWTRWRAARKNEQANPEHGKRENKKNGVVVQRRFHSCMHWACINCVNDTGTNDANKKL